jgi:hypothetical protein
MENQQNQFRERIQTSGDIVLNLDYWDCECKENYIHHISQDECPICKASKNDQPNSREDEINIHIIGCRFLCPIQMQPLFRG